MLVISSRGSARGRPTHCALHAANAKMWDTSLQIDLSAYLTTYHTGSGLRCLLPRHGILHIPRPGWV